MAKKLDYAAGELPTTPTVFAPVVPAPASTVTADLQRTTSRAVARAVTFIETSFAQPVSLAMLAALAGLSVSRFATLFRQEVGISPHRYLCLVRVRHAQRLLRHGTPPSVVATEVGFFDQSHLGRHFRRTVGVTPGDYVVHPSA
jgi:AraC-like DNA-binding protein